MVAAASACRHAAEEALIDRFFSASRLADRTAVRQIATVYFDPKDQGMVTRFTIVGVSPEERDGDITSKSVAVTAAVKPLSGPPEPKRMFVTLQRRQGGDWMITGITVTRAEPSPRPR